MSQVHSLQLFAPGQKVGNDYEVVRYIGSGNMGAVYLCRNVHFEQREVALKVLHLKDELLRQDSTLPLRFEKEVKSCFMVSHPNVVRSYSFIKEDDYVAFTMEYVGGGDLADLLEEKGQLSIEEAFNILAQAAGGVQAIHAAGIIHRDIKPENLLLTDKRQVKISDFGIARVDDGQRLTAHGGLLGTMEYLSPEYLLEGRVDERSDIYSLGLIAYEMIAGELPFKGDSLVSSLKAKMNADFEPVTKHNPRCPKEISDVITKALASDPGKRYQNAGELLRDLQRISANWAQIKEQMAAAVVDDAAAAPAEERVAEGNGGFSRREHAAPLHSGQHHSGQPHSGQPHSGQRRPAPLRPSGDEFAERPLAGKATSGASAGKLSEGKLPEKGKGRTSKKTSAIASFLLVLLKFVVFIVSFCGSLVFFWYFLQE